MFRLSCVLKPFVGSLPDPARAWLVIAMSSTLAGNLTLIGSVANLIVAERAKLSGVKLSFLDHLRVGAARDPPRNRLRDLVAHALIGPRLEWRRRR